MTILPNKKLKPSSSKDERNSDRKRQRTSPYPTSVTNDRSKIFSHPQTADFQKNKLKSKSRRDTLSRDAKMVQCDPNQFPQPKSSTSYTPPLSPLSTHPPRVPSGVPTGVPESEVENSGYNSEDEYDKRISYSEEREIEFRKDLKAKRGFEIIEVKADGACLFRSVSDQIYGDEGMHDIIRAKCCDYMELNADYFRDWVTEDFASYIHRKRNLVTHGNHIELQAMSEQYGRVFEIYEYSHNPITTFQCTDESGNPPIRLSYHNGNHYNSVRDPYRATIGIGLGIPNLNAGNADQSLLREAIDKTDLDDTEARMLLDKTKHTDYQATDQALLASVARESLQEFYHKKPKKSSKNSNSLNKLVPSSAGGSPKENISLKPSTSRLSPLRSPKPNQSTDKFNKPESPPKPTENKSTLPEVSPQDNQQPPGTSSNPGDWAVSDWVSENDEESVLEAILQQSAQEFYQKAKN